jgi:UDP-4-amino-4,6-dideoxy-N-acetyl-beta-L-altrosamine transaminase
VKREIPFFIPWVTREDKKTVLEALSSRWLTGGPKAKEFEKIFANYLGIKHAVAVNNCTAALHLAMRALNIGPGDEVIVPVFTFAATANAPLFVGAKPVFADIDEKTFNISPKDIQNKITKKTKAIIVVHYGGQPCDMKEIMQIAKRHNLHVVEDCAHSLGAEYMGQKTGSIGTIGCFSFYPTKIITTLEGGMVTTNDEEIAKQIKVLREHGMTRGAFDREKTATWYYDVVNLGYNYRLNEVQAALGISQLKRIDEINKKRIEAANYYTKKLKKTNGIIPPYEAKDRTHVYHLYAIRAVEQKRGINRDELYKKLSKKHIGLSVHYTPLHLLTFYKKTLGYKTGDFPIAEQVSKEVLSLPIYPTITKTQIDYVVKEISKIMK